jgi:hypothetical protein
MYGRVIMTTKKWYQSKTAWVAIGTTAVGFLQVLAENPLLAEHSGALVSIIGVVMLGLRWVSSSAIEGSPAAEEE